VGEKRMGKIIMQGLKVTAVFVAQMVGATIVAFGSIKAMDELENRWNKYQYKRACKKADAKRKAAEEAKKIEKKNKKPSKKATKKSSKKHSK
jgi:hypothetical protein